MINSICSNYKQTQMIFFNRKSPFSLSTNRFSQNYSLFLSMFHHKQINTRVSVLFKTIHVLSFLAFSTLLVYGKQFHRSACGVVYRALAWQSEGPQFESCWQHFLFYFIFFILFFFFLIQLTRKHLERWKWPLIVLWTISLLVFLGLSTFLWKDLLKCLCLLLLLLFFFPDFWNRKTYQKTL